MKPMTAGASDSDSPAVLRVTGLHTWIVKEDRVVSLLDDLCLRLEVGRCLALLGESGSGKSMTALSLMRLLPESADIVAGEALSGDQNWFDLPERDFSAIRGGKVAMIFQEPAAALDPIMTVGRQIDEVLARHTTLNRAERRRKAIALLDRVGIRDAGNRVDEYPFALSGGMKQRVMIAMALAADPDILIADEPTTALDVTVAAQVLALIDEIRRERRMAVLLITHDLGVAAKMADRIAVMTAGEIVEISNRDDFFARPGHPYVQKLFAAIPDLGMRGRALPTGTGGQPPLDRVKSDCCYRLRCDDAGEICRRARPELRVFGDRQIRCARFEEIRQEVRKAGEGARSADASDDSPILTVDNLSVRFPIRRGVFRRVVGHVRAVDGVTLSLTPGRTTVLVGESGCGKTTVGKAIVRLVSPASGRIRLDGRDLWSMGDAELKAFRRRVQIVFQDPFASLNPRMRIREALEEGVKAVGLPLPPGRIEDLLTAVGLEADFADRYPHEFSGGQRQRIAIARAIAVDPAVLVCDEPTSALDLSVQAQILNLLKKLQTDKRLAYLFITHNWSVVEYLADEIAVMYLGRIVEAGEAVGLLEKPAHPYTRCLIDSVLRLDDKDIRSVAAACSDRSFREGERGCAFAPRCPRVRPRCRDEAPELEALDEFRSVACHFPDG